MNDNFFYFAITYLNDWFLYDRKFFRDLKSRKPEKQLNGIRNAAKYYKISRNFSIIEEDERLGKALELLNMTNRPSSRSNIKNEVCDFSEKLKSYYGKNVISAASKLLWLKYRAPIIIYDDRAANCLREMNSSLKINDYESYIILWVKYYKECKLKIEKACKNLYNYKRFTLANNYSNKEIKNLISKRWFKERVFDKYLWYNSNNSENIL